MATVHYRNAKLLLDGADLSADLADLSIEFSAEMLDETAFGDDTRINKGGLKTGTISAAGHCEFGAGNIADVIWNENGSNVVCAVFPNGITEGSACGYAMAGVVENMDIGGSVGSLLPISFTVQGRGIGPNA